MTLTTRQTRRIYDTVRSASKALIEIERKFHEAGLHATAQAVNKASQRLGWEAASKLEKKE